MIGHPFISELFKNVLKKSAGIQGRLFDCPNMGREMNSDELGQVLQDLFDPTGIQKKYPLVLHFPPSVTGDFTKPGWHDWRSDLFFLNTSFYTGTNQVMSPNKATNTSTHTIPQDWHDMERCTVDFVSMVDKVTKLRGLVKNKFRLSQQRQPSYVFLSQVGTDKASGVRLTLYYSVFNGCNLEDYVEAEVSDITIPEDDSHPRHQL